MRLYIDLDSQTLVDGLGTKTAIPALNFKRGDSARIEVQFFRGITVVELANGSTGQFALKPSGKYDAEPVVFAAEWTKENAVTATVYVFVPDFNTVPLNDLLHSGDEDEENDEESVECMAEIEWIIDDARYSTQTVVANVANDVIKGIEGSPTVLASPLVWLAAHGVVYDPAITELTGGGASALDGIATTTVAVGRVQLVTANDVVRFYKLMDSSVPGDVSPSIVAPDDFHVATNPKRWFLQRLMTGTHEYANLNAANAAIAAIGVVFYNNATSRYEVTTDTV